MRGGPVRRPSTRMLSPGDTVAVSIAGVGSPVSADSAPTPRAGAAVDVRLTTGAAAVLVVAVETPTSCAKAGAAKSAIAIARYLIARPCELRAGSERHAARAGSMSSA